MQDEARLGRYKMICDFSGFAGYNDEMVRTWDGFYVLKRFADVRNPQDFLRGKPEGRPPQNTRPEPVDHYQVGQVHPSDL